LRTLYIISLIICFTNTTTYSQNITGGVGPLARVSLPNQKNSLVCDTVFSFPAVGSWSGGLASDGTYLYSIDHSPTILYKYDLSGNPVDSFPLPTTSTITAGDITYDGTNLWLVLEEERMVYKVDQNNGAILKSFTLPWGATFSEYFGCTYDNGFLWVSEYSQELLVKIDTISGAMVDSFHINKWVLPLEIIDGRLYGIDFATQSPGGPMILTEFDKTNGNVISSTPWCLPYTLGLATIGNTIWALSSGANFGPNRIYKFENIVLNDNIMPSGITEINIYPNPASDQISIQVEKPVNIEVMDSEGRVIIIRNLNQDHRYIDISFLYSGIYFIRITDEDRIYIKKFVKN